MKKLLTILSIVTSFALKTSAQANFQWAKSMGAAGEDRGRSVAVDASGNVYTTGYFMGIVDFDAGASVFNLTSAGSVDAFIIKFDALGTFVWAKNIGGQLMAVILLLGGIFGPAQDKNLNDKTTYMNFYSSYKTMNFKLKFYFTFNIVN